MEKFQISLEESKKAIKVADHMLIMTYPVIKDPKILLSVLENINKSLTRAVDSIVEYERLFKRVPVLNDDFGSRYRLFRQKIVSRYDISKNYLNMISEVTEMIAEHKKSPIEFSRGDRFVICSGNYRMKTITIDILKKYISQTKLFVMDIERLVRKDAGIFK